MGLLHKNSWGFFTGRMTFLSPNSVKLPKEYKDKKIANENYKEKLETKLNLFDNRFSQRSSINDTPTHFCTPIQ